MKKILRLCFLFVFAIGLSNSWAQERSVSGKVSSIDDASSLPGVNVVIKGTTTGTITDYDGNYKLNVTDGAVMVFSFIGYATEEIEVGSRAIVDVQLSADAKQLSEVVVTALGIEKDRQAIQYSSQMLDSKELNKAQDPNNILNSLSGKIAGVQVTNTGGSLGGATNVVIRGMSSINGNQPLYVVDGVPIDNQRLSSGQNVRDGVNYGNAAADLNPNDIESMTVLKGPAASVLYGSRANNGVILITTKKADKNKKAIGIDVNSSMTFDNPLKLPDFQTQYGEGFNGQHQIIDETWGPKIGTADAQGVTDWKGDVVDLQSYPDNIKDFLETQKSMSNSIALTGATETSDFRMSYTRSDQTGLLPNTELTKNTASFNVGTKLGEKLSTRVSATYINSASDNLGAQAQGNNSVPVMWLWAPRSLDWNLLKDYRDYEGTQGDADGTQQRKWINYFDNPYFLTQENTYSQDKNRIIGNISLDYAVTDWLKLSYKVGVDTYSDNREQRNAVGTGGTEEGSISYQNYNVSQLNHDFTALVSQKINEDIDVNFLAGFNVNKRKTESLFASGTALIAPGLYSLNNAGTFGTPPTNFLSERRLAGAYGSLDLGYKNFLYLTVTGRNDWSSTLPTDNNTFFYPSIGLGFAFTELVDLGVLSYGKIRANWAQTGKDVAPYQLQSVYGSPGENNFPGNNTTFPFNGVAGFTVGNNIGNSTLQPEITTSIEFGADLSFFNGRANIDVTYYDADTDEQLINVSVPETTGYETKTVNAGKINNSGWEVMLSGNPLQMGDFRWDVSLNFTKNVSEVIELNDGLESLAVGGPQSLRVGQPYGVIWQRDVKYNEFGQVVINPTTGLPEQADEESYMGDPNPDWLLGIQNSFSYKGLDFSFLIDMRQGGTFRSFSSSLWRYTGQTQETIHGREGGLVVDGVYDNGDGTYSPNTTVITAQNWAKRGAFSTRYALYGASYAKLREVRLGYNLPSSILSKTPFQSINIAVIGRNLLLWNTEQDYVDPEVTTRGLSNAVGTEYASLPSTRSIGFNLRFTL